MAVNDVDEDRAEETVAAVNDEEGRTFPAVADVTDLDAVHAMADAVAYLPSDDAAFGSGRVLSVSGG